MSTEIRTASLRDVLCFLKWVKEEYDSGSQDTHWKEFRYQYGWMLRRLLDRQIWVLADKDGVSSFLIGDREHNHLQYLAVKKSKRGLGYGEKLAQFYIKYLTENNAPFVIVECSPPSSKGFWGRLGLDSSFISSDRSRFLFHNNWVAKSLREDESPQELQKDILLMALRLQKEEDKRLQKSLA